MFDKLIEFLLTFIEQILPVAIIKQYEKGALLRLGKYQRVLEPGLHFKIPMADEIDVYPVVTTTLTLPPQSIMTKCGKNVVARAHIKYKVSDLSIYAIQVVDATDALSDTTSGVIFSVIREHTLDELRTLDIGKLITKKAKSVALTWGINLMKVTISDFSEMRSYRLLMQEPPLK
jgi:regulator of protease activity HflC (stomatin/prohibitin superfamily)